MVGLFAFVIYQGVKDAEITKLDARLESHADKVETELEEDSDEPVFPDVPRILALHTEGLPEVRMQLIDPEGRIVIIDSMLSSYPITHWREAFGGNPQKDILHVGLLSYRCCWVPAEINGKVPFVVQLAAPMSEVELSLRRLRVLFLTSIPFALLLTALAAYVITRIAFRPVTDMIQSTRQITARNLDQRLSLPSTRDEIRLLGETLNDMIDRNDTAFKSQRQFIADASHEIRTPLTIICTEL